MALTTNQLFVLKLLDLAGKIECKTKLQKLMFLAKVEEKVPLTYDFKKYHYGPFSFDLSDDLNALKQTDFINESMTVMGSSEGSAMVKSVFTLTEDGKKELEENKAKLSSEGVSALSITINKWNSSSLDKILKYVYSKYITDESPKLAIAG